MVTTRIPLDAVSILRALRIMDAVVKALEARGFCVSVQRDLSNTTVDVRGVEVHICLREQYESIELPPDVYTLRMEEKNDWYEVRPRYDRKPTGRLSLQILAWEPTGARKCWNDGKRQRVERCLNAFVVGLVKVAEALKELERSREEQQLRWEEEQQLRWEEERQRAEEQRRVAEAERARAAEFRAAATAWNEARLMRAYLRAYRVTQRPEQEDAPDDWLTWAEEFVEELDRSAPGRPRMRRRFFLAAESSRGPLDIPNNTRVSWVLSPGQRVPSEDRTGPRAIHPHLYF